MKGLPGTRRRVWHSVALVAGCATLQGCAALIPVPLYFRPEDTRTNISGQSDFSFVTVGKTTRAQVMLRMGEPDGLRNDTGRQVFYRSTHDVLGVVNAGGMVVVTQSNNYVVIEYDARGVVRRISSHVDLDWVA